ncbi:MAG TPA: hypothetical protein DEF51_36340 [Myxococcales bacterium]|nr:hypothetical protein [Myxococcales bacterium]
MDFRLPWSELDPARRAAPDLEDARERAVAALKRKRGRTASGRELAERELRFLVWTALGTWCSGWHDPVRTGGASLVWDGAASVGDDDELTAGRVVEALEDWQAWLGALRERFQALPADPDGDEVDALVHAGRELLPVVLERTSAQGDWSRTFANVMSWYVQACGRANEDLSELIATAMEGQVEPGVAPSSAAAQALVEELALALAVRDRPPFEGDALEAWWAVRAASPWGIPTPAGYRPTERDAHRQFIRLHDRPRSTVRADAMTRALVRARYGAKQRLKLDQGLLREWLEIALVSSDFTLRRGEVTSRDGGERYARPKDLEQRLAQVLADATDDAVPPMSRAARVYMDLGVLCPFSDGNARVARLTFDYVLSRDGLGMHDATPIFCVRRWAHDTSEPWRFQRVLAACTGPS